MSEVEQIIAVPVEIKEENANEEADKKDDPFAYLERGEFSSENYKIEIKNLPKYYGMHEFRKLLNEKLKLNSNKIKTPRKNSPYAFVCFRNNEDRDNALEVLSNFTWKGKQLQAIKAKPAPDPLVKKRKQDSRDNENEPNKRGKIDERTQEERLKDTTIPFWKVDYKEQLSLKQEEIRKILKKLGGDLWHQNSELRTYLESQKKLHDGLPCELLDIRYSDTTEGYRNKCEFSVGINEETNEPTVGFRIGAYVNGITGVGPVDNLKHIPNAMKKAVKLFETFVRQDKELQVFNPELQSGHYRQLCVRTAVDNQLMLVAGIHPQNLTAEQIAKFKADLIEFFSNGPGKEAEVTSLYYQEIVKKNPGDLTTPSEHLWGETHIFETIHGLKFRISPEAFFQINTAGAEILYDSAIELANVNENSTVLDVCCGTGTIGLCFAKKCSQVLGLEIIPQAIIDAKENAKANSIENSEFYDGKAEDILGDVCYRATNEDVIAVLDPPRAGLHQRAILKLRKINKINKLVYVSCNPNAALKNFVDLGRPESKTLHGEPLVPVKAVAVDMFPHTKHCELVICFERWDKIATQLKATTTEQEEKQTE